MVDLSAAFDHLQREWLFTAVRLIFGADSTIVNILESIYNQTSSYLEDPGHAFKTTAGVRQGGCESPYLYNIYANHVMDVFVEKCLNEGIEGLNIPFEIPAGCSENKEIFIGVCILIWLGYADDLCLFAYDSETLQRMMDILDETFTAYGLSINQTKTETLILNWQLGKNKNLEEYPKSVITMRSKPIKNVQTFRYLGATEAFNSSGTSDTEINNRIAAAKGKFFELKSLFTNHKVHLQSRLMFLNSLIRSRLTYASQTWTLTKKQLEKLEQTVTYLQRFMIKGGFQRRSKKIDYTTKDGRSGEFSKILITNEEVGKICKSEPISKFIERQQSNWIGHIVRTEDKNYIKQLTFEGRTGRSLKRGLTDSTFRQVCKRYGAEGKSVDEMIGAMMERRI